MQVVTRVPGTRRQDSFANIRKPGVVRVPHLPNLRVPFVGHGDRIDLKAIARAALSAAGVETVHDIGECTLCGDPKLFFSHRRDGGVTGRQAGLAWLTPIEDA